MAKKQVGSARGSKATSSGKKTPAQAKAKPGKTAKLGGNASRAPTQSGVRGAPKKTGATGKAAAPAKGRAGRSGAGRGGSAAKGQGGVSRSGSAAKGGGGSRRDKASPAVSPRGGLAKSGSTRGRPASSGSSTAAAAAARGDGNSKKSAGAGRAKDVAGRSKPAGHGKATRTAAPGGKATIARPTTQARGGSKGATAGASKVRANRGKVGSDERSAERFGGSGDFGTPVERALPRGTDPDAAEGLPPEGQSGDRTADGDRTHGVGSPTDSPGSGAGGDLDPDFVGVAGGAGLSQSPADRVTIGPESTTGGSAEFASGPPAAGRSQQRGDRDLGSRPHPSTVGYTDVDASTTDPETRTGGAGGEDPPAETSGVAGARGTGSLFADDATAADSSERTGGLFGNASDGDVSGDESSDDDTSADDASEGESDDDDAIAAAQRSSRAVMSEDDATEKDIGDEKSAEGEDASEDDDEQGGPSDVTGTDV